MIKFLLDHFKVDDVGKINPWAFCGENAIPIWEPAKEVNINFVASGLGICCVPPPKNPEKDYQPQKLYRGLLVDLNKVSVRSICVTDYENPSHMHYYIKHHFIPKSLEESERMAQLKQMAKIVGREFGVAMEILPNSGKVCCQTIVEENPNLDDAFSKTFMQMTKEILMTGIIQTTAHISDLPKNAHIYNDNGQEMRRPVECWYILPQNHVLCWKLHIDEYYRKKRKLFAVEFEIDGRLTFYIVDNITFDILKSECVAACINKIDVRPLGQVGIEVKEKFAQEKNSSLRVGVSVSFLAYPNTKAHPPYLPILHPRFKPYAHIVQQEEENLLYEKEEKEQQEKRKKG